MAPIAYISSTKTNSNLSIICVYAEFKPYVLMCDCNLLATERVLVSINLVF